MPTVACPACGEGEEISGERRGDDIVPTCDRCGEVWDRDLRALRRGP